MGLAAGPERRQRVRTPTLLQSDQTECGAVSLGIVLAFFGRWVPIEELRAASAVTRDGSNGADLLQAARKFGLEARGWRREPHQLQAMRMPLILFWEFSHFLVLEGHARGRYYVNDPASGRRTVDEDEFDEAFTGVAVSFEPGADFERGGRRPGIVRRLWPWLQGARSSLAFALACGLLLSFTALAVPLLLGVFVDYVLNGREPSWAAVLIAGATAAGGVVYLLTWLRERCLRLLSVRLSIARADRFIAHLFRLRTEFFTHRYAGDLTARMRSIDEVAGVATRQFVGVVIELVTSLLFVALMLVYDPLLAAVVVALGAASALLTRAVTRSRIDENRRLQREAGRMQGTGMHGLRTIDTLQALSAESDFFAHFTGYQARELLARQRFTELGHVIAALPGMFLIAGNAAVLGLGGLRVMSGDMTLGAMTGFYVLAASFLLPIGRFVQFADLFQVLEGHLQRLDDVFDAPEDAVLARPAEGPAERPSAFARRLRLTGRVELRNVTFGYKATEEPLLEDVSLVVEPGQRVAIVGPTGSGKSTLASLAAGVHRPWSGEILFDGQPLAEVPRGLLTDSVSLVDQHIFLFAGSVRDNLTMWDRETPDQALVAAARDADIHAEIIARPQGYDAPVLEGGRNFSGGQQQRLEIARALVSNPTVLILDEATCALDPLAELRIDDALRRRGITCLIVAHRLSTIRDSDLIVVLDRGREVQRGTHRALMADTDGLYRQLMEAE